MRKKIHMLVLILAVAASASVGGGTADGGTASPSCRSGNITYEGLRARVYCGPATATVKFAGRTLSYRGGSCTRTAAAVELGIGTLILDAKDPKGLPRSFGISVGRIFGIGQPAARDGVSKSVTIASVDGGKRYGSMKAQAILAGNRTRGTFTGRLFTGGTVSGTFRCS